ncbi:MAG: hypothetical protein NTW14_00425 [bacterium]|nr:hypothetical protein [bacterium]
MKKSIPVLKAVWFLLIIGLVFVGRDLNFGLVLTLTIIALAAPILREIFSKSDLDERQIQISHSSSHIAYFVYTVLLLFATAREWLTTGEIPSALLFVLICSPLIIKFIVCQLQDYGSVKGLSGFFDFFFRGIIPSRKIDERQNEIGNLSSHIAFYVFLTLTLFVVLFKYVRNGRQEPDPIWDMLLFTPLMAKLYASYFQTYDAARGARFILSTLAGLFFIFVALSHGFSFGALMEALPFLVMAGMIYLSKYAPKFAGIVVMLVAITMLVLMKGWSRFDFYVAILMWSLIPIPLFLCGLAFLTEKREKLTEVITK